MGARVLVGGERDGAQESFYPPTVLADVRPGMPVFSEETFGPVAAVTAAVGDHELVTLANASDYGLGASIWTSDLDRARQLATRLEVGCVFVKLPSIVRSGAPFRGREAQWLRQGAGCEWPARTDQHQGSGAARASDVYARGAFGDAEVVTLSATAV